MFSPYRERLLTLINANREFLNNLLTMVIQKASPLPFPFNAVVNLIPDIDVSNLLTDAVNKASDEQLKQYYETAAQILNYVGGGDAQNTSKADISES